MADDIVKEAIEAFETAQEAETANRESFKEDIEFGLLDEQWPEKIRLERELEGRPVLTLNKLGPVIRQVVNDARQNRPATTVHPVDGNADKETADVLSGLIRSIENGSDAEVAYDTAVGYAVAGGFGYWRINTEYALNAIDEDGLKSAGESAFDQNIFIRRIANPLTVYGDPYSQGADSSDWMQAHVIEILKREQFKAKYPDAEQTDFDGTKWADVSSPWKNGEDIQIAEFWKREKSIRQAYAVQLGDEIIVMFKEELDKEQAKIAEMGAQVIGQPRPVQSFKVTQHIVSGAEELSKVDWPGAYIPIVPVYGEEVNLEGERHLRSLIRPAKDAMRRFNYAASTLTEMQSLAPRVPYVGPKGAFETDAAKWSTANSQSHAYIEFDGPIAPQRQPFASVPTGMMQELMNASDDIKAITGIYDASLGARSNETSGVAIRTRQMEGDVSTFHFIDNLTRAIRHSGRVIVDLIPKVYSGARIVRILGEDGTSQDVQLNQPYEAQGIARLHDVRTGRYDVVVKAGPSFTTRREEAATQMVELLRAYPDAAPIIGDLLAKNLDWPGADEIAKRLEALLPPAARGEQEGGLPPEIAQQMQQMAQALQQCQAELAEAKTQNDLKAEELAIKRFEAETDRIEAVHKMTQPTELPNVEMLAA